MLLILLIIGFLGLCWLFLRTSYENQKYEWNNGLSRKSRTSWKIAPWFLCTKDGDRSKKRRYTDSQGNSILITWPRIWKQKAKI